MRGLIALFMFAILLSQSTLAQRSLSTIALHNSSPAQVIGAIKPHLSPNSTVTAYQNQLVINATDAEWQTIRQLVKQLDQAGQQLLISVSTTDNHSSQSQGYSTSANWGNDDIRVRINDRGLPTETRTRITVNSRSRGSQQSGGQQLRATEGLPAFISVGQAIPFRSSQRNGVNTVQLEDVSTGFYVTAYINEQQVRLTVDQRKESYQPHRINTQQLYSSVTGQLGEWITIGHIAEQNHTQNQQLLSRQSSASSQAMPIKIKVDLTR